MVQQYSVKKLSDGMGSVCVYVWCSISIKPLCLLDSEESLCLSGLWTHT